MKKIGKIVQKILGITAILLILGTIGIFMYPKIAEKTDIDDKAVAFLSNQIMSPEEETVTDTEISDSGIVSGVSDNNPISESVAPTEEVKLKDNFRTQTWSQEEKDALKTAYNTVLNRMGLNAANLLFYEMKNIDDIEYYSFQVVDDFGNAYEDLLLYDAAANNLYWHDKKGYLDTASSSDCIFSGTVPGNKDAEYEDDSWEKVLKGYMNAILNERNSDKASSYVDTSCYYLAKLSELRRSDFVDATEENQKYLIEQADSLEKRKNGKKIENYSWNYKIDNTSKYIDEYDMDWVEAYISLDLDVTAHGQTEAFGDNYCVYLRQYEYGWRVAALTTEEYEE